MLQKTCCSICLSINKRTINIYGTDLQNVYEKLAEFKAKAELCFLCFICRARLRQVANLQNAVTSRSQSPKTLVRLVTQNIENETIPYHVVLTKEEPPEFDIQERHLEHDEVTIKPEIENSECEYISALPDFICKAKFFSQKRDKVKEDIDKIEIIENSINYGEEEETTIQSKNALDGTTQDSQVVDSVYTQQKQKVPGAVIVQLSQSDINKYEHQSPTAHLVVEDPKDSWGIKHEERPNTDDCEGRGHASAAQSSKTPHTCDVRLKNYSTRRHLLRHTKTGELPIFSCDICSKKFSSKRNLTIHTRVHTGEKPFSCDICPKKFFTKTDLTVHTTVHTGEKPFSCDICSKKFSRKRYLTLHKRIHTGEKPYSCDVCPKKFSKKRYLTQHKRCHTGETFSCDICSKKFSSKKYWTQHKRFHKTYRCDFCLKNFCRENELIVHTRVHTGEKPFSCDICPSKFTTKKALTVHTRKHTGEKLFSCDVLNPDKTKFMVLRAENQIKKVTALAPVVHVKNKNIQIVYEARNLGLLLDEELKKHVY